MARLIDADKLLEEINDRYEALRGTTNHADRIIMDVLQSVVDDINEMPTAEAETDRHGRWIINDIVIDNNGRTTPDWPRCSECGKQTDLEYNYCPRCGARMDLDEIEMSSP